MNKLRVAIIELTDPAGTITYARHQNTLETLFWLMEEGAAVSVAAWNGTSYDDLFNSLSGADRVLLWNPSVYLNLPATKMALGGQKLLEALDQADVVTAPCYRDVGRFAVFTGRETFARDQRQLGCELDTKLVTDKTPVTVGGFGIYWTWIHTLAFSRLPPAPGRSCLVAGIDITLSRRLIEGGCSVKCDPRLAVTSEITSLIGWSLPLEPQASFSAPEPSGASEASGSSSDTP